MLILLGLAVAPLFVKMLIGDVDNDKNRKKRFLIYCGIIIALVMGLRHYGVGTRDTENYRKLFFGAMNYSNIVDFFDVHKLFENVFLLSEIIFYAFTWCFSKIIPDYQCFLLAVSAFITYSVMRFIYKNSENVLISVIMYICLGLLTFNMNGMRQAVAMAICLFSYNYAKNKKLVPFLLVVFIAVLVHKTAIFFVLIYFISYLKFNIKSFAIFNIAIIMFVLYADRLVALFDEIVDKNYSEGEPFKDGGYVTLIIYALMLIFAFVVGGKKLSEKDFSFMLYITILGGVLYLERYLSIQIYERLSYYFFYSSLLILPKSVARIDEEEKPIITTTIIILSILLFAYRLYGSAFHNYMFFWG